MMNTTAFIITCCLYKYYITYTLHINSSYGSAFFTNRALLLRIKFVQIIYEYCDFPKYFQISLKFKTFKLKLTHKVQIPQCNKLTDTKFPPPFKSCYLHSKSNKNKDNTDLSINYLHLHYMHLVNHYSCTVNISKMKKISTTISATYPWHELHWSTRRFYISLDGWCEVTHYTGFLQWVLLCAAMNVFH